MMKPPKRATAFLRWFCREDYLEEIEGDLTEVFNKHYGNSPRKANWQFTISVLLYFRPQFIKSFKISYQRNSYSMLKSYFKVGWRNLLKSKGYSFINIGGLAIGMTVVGFISLWIYDELSFNKYHKNYDGIAQVWSFGTNTENMSIEGAESIQYPVSTTLRNNYPQYFKHVLIAWWIGDYTLSTAEKKFSRKGEFIQEGALEMLSLKMLKGSYESLNDPHSIVLSRSTAESIFGSDDPINKTLSIDGRMEAKVTGIYEDLPRNNRFSEVQFFTPWSLFVLSNDWVREKDVDWDNRPFNIYIQLQPNVTMDLANKAIKDLYARNMPADYYKTVEKFKPFVQLVPMSTWHLYSEFKDGKPAGGRITYVWLFGTIGIFVLLLACINFINLSTAQSQKRAREVGVRKAMGSVKGQLVSQFLSESFIVVAFAFTLSLALMWLLNNLFNQWVDKNVVLPFSNLFFWLIAIAFIVVTSFIAGIYPAFHLSSFQPVKVLKGVLRTGRFAAVPRKILVIVQFTVSVVLVIGTFVVYKQIQFAQNRPIGYDKKSLITLEMSDPNYKGKLDVLKTELLRTGVVSEVAASSSALTEINNVTSGYEWPGKDPNMDAEFAVCNVTRDFGKTINWSFVDGRDFSKDLSSDSTDAIIINEAAVKYMGLRNPVGQQLTDVNEFGQKKWSKTIIGVVKDLVMESPYEPVQPTLYFYNKYAERLLHVKIKPTENMRSALSAIEQVINKVVPTALFNYKFVDEEYARKFSQEERISKLSGIFSIVAILISCLGLFGLASFVAEQRTREIGIRKVLGATVSGIWQMLSKDFVVLVIIASFIASPIAFYLMNNWLQKYEYHTEIAWWIFLLIPIGALLVTLLTVSFQAVRAALMNPVKSLRSL